MLSDISSLLILGPVILLFYGLGIASVNNKKEKEDKND